jgi:hypothetical protein
MLKKTILVSSFFYFSMALNAQVDASLESIVLNRYAEVSVANQLKLNVKNNGSSTITSLSVNWNDGTDHIQTISTSIASGATVTVNHPVLVTYNSIVEKSITVTIVNVNNSTDPVTSNNSKATAFNTVSDAPHKNVVLEESTGTWCVNCPGGIYYIDYIMDQVPNNFIPISIHHGGNDPMIVDGYYESTGLTAYPKGNLNRSIKDVTAGTGWIDGFNTLVNQISPVSITATVINSGSNATINASATFNSNFSNGRFRYAAVITEDQVTGTAAAYDQANTYTGNLNVPFFGTQPNPVPASLMEYQHVARAILNDAYDGVVGSIPALINDGLTVDYTFNYTVPSTSNIDNMHAVIMIIDEVSGEIVNSEKVSIKSDVSGGIDKKVIKRLSIYPNPSEGIVTVSFEANESDYTISVHDLSGKIVYSMNQTSTNGVQNVQLPLSNLEKGAYILTLDNEGVITSEQIMIK